MSDKENVQSAPYVSFRMFTNFLDKLESTGIPQHVDRHYWGSFMSGSSGVQLMGALRFLDLIDPATSEPTPTLEKLTMPESRKETLRALLKEKYSALWEAGIDPTRTTPGHLESGIGKAYRIEGETKRKAATFFIHAAKFAEFPLSSQLIAGSRATRSTSSNASRPRQRNRKNLEPVESQIEKPFVQREADVGKVPENRYGILFALLEQLPPQGSWSIDRRDRWLAALQANLDFLINVEDDDFYTTEDDPDNVED